MKHSQESYIQLVSEAWDGTLQLPAFQREWKWESSKVISLYDSLRKQFPIGSFLFLDSSTGYNLSPRLYKGSKSTAKPQRVTLDGQQRITSGLVLIYDIQYPRRFFLNLKCLLNLADINNLDYRNEEQVIKFVKEIDDSDNYMISTTRKIDINSLLLQQHLLSSTQLASKISAQKALEPYENKYQETKDFIKYVIIPYFTLDNELRCPVITLTKSESLAAVTKIFATLNTTGKTLTPIEIVTAILYANEVNLKQDVKEFQEASDYLTNMDTNGEVLLQTIALLAGDSPKKSMLPKTITYERFKDHYKDALNLLDMVGEFLTSELGAGLKDTRNLIPYDSILAPMAACFKEIKGLEGTNKNKALKKIETWFIGAALGQRYIQGAGSKQEIDARDMKEWIRKDKAELKPSWLNNVHISNQMKTAGVNSSFGKLMKCLMNLQKPDDPVETLKIGYYDGADETPQDHHIWPKKFCTPEHLPGWDDSKDSTDLALNILPISYKTNRRWTNMPPKNQIEESKNAISNTAKSKEVFNKLMLSDECISILEKPKTIKKDYSDFIDARFKTFCNIIAKWGFTSGEQEYEETDEDS